MPPRTRLRTAAASQMANAVSLRSTEQPHKKAVSPLKRAEHPQTPTSGNSPSKKKLKTIVKQALLQPVPPPPRWREAYALIEEQRKTFIAPVDTMGCDKAGDVDINKLVCNEDSASTKMGVLKEERSERDRRLSCLVSLMLSSQTKDEVTAQATLNLRLNLENSLTVDSLRNASLNEIENCINKVGFWKKKAQFIKLMADDLFFKHDSDVPKTLEELVALKGVGPKMAFLALSNAWSINLGIGVDTHVHRISNRLGWVQTSDPEATRIHLESWLPRDLFQEINHLLVGFGQVICLPVGPKCEDCYVGRVPELCPSSKAEANREKIKSKSLKRIKSTSSSQSPKKGLSRSQKAHIDIKLEDPEDCNNNSDPDKITSPSVTLKSSRFFTDSRLKQDQEQLIKQESPEDADDKQKQKGKQVEIDPMPIRTDHEATRTSIEAIDNSPLASSPLSEIDDHLTPQPCSSHQALSW